MYQDNGILFKVPGEFDARASQTLPPAATATEATMWATVDTGALWCGLVRIRYVRQLMKHRRHSHWAWVSEYAEKVPPSAE